MYGSSTMPISRWVVDAWNPPEAYGCVSEENDEEFENLPDRDVLVESSQQINTAVQMMKSRKGMKPKLNPTITEDNTTVAIWSRMTVFESSVVPLQPLTTPSRAYYSTRFRLDRAMRAPVTPRIPQLCDRQTPSVVVVNVELGNMLDEISAMDVSSTGDAIAVGAGSRVYCYSMHSASGSSELDTLSDPRAASKVIDSLGVDNTIVESYEKLFFRPEQDTCVSLFTGRGVKCLALASDMPLVLVGMERDGRVELLETQSGRKLVSYIGHNLSGGVHGVQWSPLSHYFASLSKTDRNVKWDSSKVRKMTLAFRIWRTDNRSSLRTFAHPCQPVVGDWHPHGQTYWTASSDSCLRCWDFRMARVARDVSLPNGGIPTAISISRDGSGVAVSDENKMLHYLPCTSSLPISHETDGIIRSMSWCWPTPLLLPGSPQPTLSQPELVTVQEGPKAVFWDTLRTLPDKPGTVELDVGSISMDYSLKILCMRFTNRNCLMLGLKRLAASDGR